ncbi:FAD/NAD(P)-binding domain-containing protein [Sistotremastrum niveocremeum HHB9708]|uniref:FAD/NAD(P)-binding domain-containing protein n=2 Tax=Sistotremastraceae TaxID=3402574 RepID=A0A164QAI9_9AGAM|nr:FAD/NAD(P)-binding domain-containing protein [Sistotremastrum niveocremeum HHB9708]KZT33076.1 FAD/NAD(P)-binding domain-containing protein [Sistotremastrum suecicum HHB10207 ss-3]
MSRIQPSTVAVAIVGAGASALITGKTLLNDGFDNLTLITRDSTPGGTWAGERVYPALRLNNVHGEYHFSSLPMPGVGASRLKGSQLTDYMESFAGQYLKGHIRFRTEVINVRRPNALETIIESEVGEGWIMTVRNLKDGSTEELKFDKIVLCTGGCSEPNIPTELQPPSSLQIPVIHSSKFWVNVENIVPSLQSTDGGSSPTVVLVGGGKSTQDIAAFLCKKGIRTKVVFETADSFISAPDWLPAFLRRSRLMSIMSPTIDLRSRLERFLHKTRIGSMIVQSYWESLQSNSFNLLKIPRDSPLRRTHSVFWSIRVNDESYATDSFFTLCTEGKIELIAPTRVIGYGHDGRSVLLKSGETIPADAVILGTGYGSSWERLFDKQTADDIGLNRTIPDSFEKWDYETLKNPPAARPKNEQWALSIYRGLVPAKSILRHDLAINGAVFSSNNGYTFEAAAHWISSYFLRDPFLKLPSSVEAAMAETARVAAFVQQRYPNMLLWTSDSYSANIVFFGWPQYVDQLLEDMSLPSVRSGGNWLTWAFSTVSVEELKTLKNERGSKRDTTHQSL